MCTTMPCPLYDAHCHLADSRLTSFADEIQTSLENIHCKYSVVNGTSPSDWHDVIDYSKANPTTLAAIGLHPWKVNSAPEDWQQIFLDALNSGVHIIGEIGLDQWIEGYDIETQEAAFRWQLEQAVLRNLPVSIHCLKAITPLTDTLKSTKLPKRGIHIHALNASVEAATPLIEMGAYFSFNAGQLKPTAKHINALIRSIPNDRILIETDAPDFLPPKAYQTYTLGDPTLNHPANLKAAYQLIAEIRDVAFEQLSLQVEINFQRYFLS